MSDSRFQNLTPQTFKEYMKTHHEREYTLIDVRQPMEYATNHIPGAIPIPLPYLESEINQLPPDQDWIFYCRSGGRSLVASTIAVESRAIARTIYNLSGGILAWDGKTLPDYPKIQIFERINDPEKRLLTAIDLEKGAFRFYDFVLNEFGSKSIIPKIKDLVQAEMAHARMVYQFLSKDRTLSEDFETLFERLEGNILEGGESIDHMLKKVRKLEGDPCLNIIELALTMEYSAYDLYRTIAADTKDISAKSAFLSLCQAEKDHIQLLVKTINMC